jgi:hypothetical protein
MDVVGATWNLRLGLVAISFAAVTLLSSAVFTADRPGADLEPVGNADELVHILQGESSILWTSLSGTVSFYTVRGWPSSDGESELGGALVIEKPDDGLAGVIKPAEKPMSLSFEIDG